MTNEQAVKVIQTTLAIIGNSVLNLRGAEVPATNKALEELQQLGVSLATGTIILEVPTNGEDTDTDAGVPTGDGDAS